MTNIDNLTVGTVVSHWVREKPTDVRTGHVTAVNREDNVVYVTNLHLVTDLDAPVWGTWLSVEAFADKDWPFQAVIEP